jgi:hypothetical protein
VISFGTGMYLLYKKTKDSELFETVKKTFPKFKQWMILTACGWGLLEKLPALLLLKHLPTFYGTRRFITAFTRALRWSLS